MPGRLLGALPGRWGSGSVVNPPPPPPPWVLPRALCTGVSTRSFDTFLLPSGAPGVMHALVTAGSGGSVVIDPPWSTLQPTPGALSTAAVTELIGQLDLCQAAGLKVRLRIRVGRDSPDWVKDDPAVGRFVWATNHGGAEFATWADAGVSGATVWKVLPGGIPGFWRAGYWALYRDLHVRLAAVIGTHPALAEVVAGLASTQFQEPCIQQLNWQPNLDSAYAAGYTEATHDACFAQSWQIHEDVWAPHLVASYTAYNPIGGLRAAASVPSYTVTGGSPSTVTLSGQKYYNGNVARTVVLMETQMRLLGGLAVLGNNSLVGPNETNATYVQMYARHLSARQAVPPTPIGCQTETLAKINSDPAHSVIGTLDRAVGMGMDNAELPVGCQIFDPLYPNSYITAAIAGPYNDVMKANAAPLMVGGSGGNAWDVRDTSVPTAATAPFFVAGALWADPQGQGSATGITVAASGTLRLHRPGAAEVPAVTQFGNAALALGGTVAYSVNASGDDTATISGVPLDVTFDTAPAILTGATGAQVRAFLAAAIQGEGNVNGMIADDFSAAHLAVLKTLVASVAGFGIASTITGTNFRTLTTDDLPGSTPKFGAYPFAQYGRCPGGGPASGSIGAGGVRTTGGASVPSPPTGLSALVSGAAGSQQVALSWTAPSVPGGTLLAYTLTVTPGPINSTPVAGAVAATVTGLPAGTSMTATLRANNATGASSPATVTFNTTAVAASPAILTAAFAYGPSTPVPTVAQANAHAAAYDLIMCKTQHWGARVAAMKAINPDIDLWHYFNGILDSQVNLFPLVCNDAGGNYQLQSQSSFGLWCQDPTLAGWRARCITQVQQARTAGFTGAFNDNFGPALWNGGYLSTVPAGHAPSTPGGATNPVTGVKYTLTTWYAALVALVQAERAAVSGIKVVANAIGNGTEWAKAVSPSLLLVPGGVEGALAEIWMRDARSDPAMYFHTEAKWLEEVNLLSDFLVRYPNRQLVVSTKHWSTPSPTAAESLAVSRFTLASYLLGAGNTAGANNAYYCYNNAYSDPAAGLMDPTIFPYSVDWRLNPGIPVEAMQHVGSVYKRAYTAGLVVVNPTTAAATYTITGGPYSGWTPSAGAAAATVPNGSFTLSAHTGLILTR